MSKSNTKLCFSQLSNFHKLFYAIVKNSDKAYSQINHEDFFKNGVLKYSEIRAQNTPKRMSSPRTKLPVKKPNILNFEVEGTD